MSEPAIEPAVGADIASLCSKCGDVWHVVVAMVKDKVAKVECKECKAVHRYKDPKGKKKAAPKKKSTTTRKRTTKKAAEVEPAVVEADLDKPVRKYRTSEEFDPGQRVNHVTFGEGVVQRGIGPGKMEVMFAGETKLLACAKPDLTLGNAPRPRLATEVE